MHHKKHKCDDTKTEQFLECHDALKHMLQLVPQAISKDRETNPKHMDHMLARDPAGVWHTWVLCYDR